MPGPYFTPAQYQSRSKPSYDTDSGNVVWQPDVYDLTARIGDAIGASRLIDVGCGRAAKLVGHRPRFDLTGIDIATNIDHCRTTYPFATWIEHDLEEAGPLPIDLVDLRESVVVCADVIEHLVAPENLLGALAAALQVAPAALISTPERGLTSGIRHLGPPRNQCHVREWSIREFQAFLNSAGLVHQSLGLTRSNDRADQPHTILAIVARDAKILAEILPIAIDFEVGAPKHNSAWIRTARAATALLGD
jgi:hypothetical protein